MRKLSIEEIMKYSELSTELEKLTDLSSWEDIYFSSVAVNLKIGYILIIKVLKEIGILSEDYSNGMPVADDIDFENNEDLDYDVDNFIDFAPSFSELYFELTNTVYHELGWTIEEIDILGLIVDIAESHNLEVDYDEGDCPELNIELISDSIKDFVGQSILTICKDSLVNTLYYVASRSIIPKSFYLLRNKKIADFKNLLQVNPLWKKSKIILKIDKIIEDGISPLVVNIPSCTILENVYSEEFALSMLLYGTDNGEWIDGAHIQLAKIINAVLLDQLIDIALSQIKGIAI